MSAARIKLSVWGAPGSNFTGAERCSADRVVRWGYRQCRRHRPRRRRRRCHRCDLAKRASIRALFRMILCSPYPVAIHSNRKLKPFNLSKRRDFQIFCLVKSNRAYILRPRNSRPSSPQSRLAKFELPRPLGQMHSSRRINRKTTGNERNHDNFGYRRRAGTGGTRIGN